MTKRQTRRAFGTTVGLSTAGALGILATTAPADETALVGDDRPVLGGKPEGPIKVVVQITSPDAGEDGVGKGLAVLKHVRQAYLAAGVDPARIDVRGVFHGGAADHLLADDAWDRLKNGSQGNPNSRLIAELTRTGVHVELCEARRVASDWAKSDLHSDVELVADAYVRIVDLQRQGYAYIRG